MASRLTPEDMDWLRRIRLATDVKCAPPAVPAEIANKLRAFGLVTPHDFPAVTERGREALLDQDMRDAEDR